MIEIKNTFGTVLYTTDSSTLEGLDFSNLDLSYADLEGLNLRGCDLSFTNLRRANCRLTSFDDCNMNGTDLTGALFHHTSFKNKIGRFTTDNKDVFASHYAKPRSNKTPRRSRQSTSKKYRALQMPKVFELPRPVDIIDLNIIRNLWKSKTVSLLDKLYIRKWLRYCIDEIDKKSLVVRSFNFKKCKSYYELNAVCREQDKPTTWHIQVKFESNKVSLQVPFRTTCDILNNKEFIWNQT